MPVYEYKCPECGFEIEVAQKIKDPDPNCENCEHPSERNLISKKIKMIRQISLGSFSLKGRCWSRDGYKK